MGLRPEHIIIIILIAILIFAPSRLTQLVRGFKGMFSQFRKETAAKEKDKDAATDASSKSKSKS